MRTLLLLFFTLSFSSIGYSQLSQPCQAGDPISYDDCSIACAICDVNLLNGVSFNSGSWTPDHVDELSYACNGVNIVMNNNGWVGFVANATTLDLEVTYSNCTGGNASGVGMQALIVESADCNNFSLIACKGDASAAANDSYILNATGLTIGASYYLVLDGFAGSVCDVEVEVLNNAGGPPTVGTSPTFSGPSNICPNEVVEFTYGPVANASLSDWQLPPGASIVTGDDPSIIVLDQFNPITVLIAFGPNTVSDQICVTPYNGCSTGGQSCIPVTVSPIPDTQLPSESICFGETYVGIDGNSYTNNNTSTISTTFPLQEYFGGGVSGTCDSLVLIDMIYLPNKVTNSPTIYACEGDEVIVGSTTVTSDQQISATETSYNGCDSTINVFVDFIDNTASANGPLSITCTNNAQLTGSGTTSTGTFAWYDPSGNLINNNLTASANDNGQFFFVVTNTENGLTCTDTAFVDVTADFDPPQNITASAAGQIGCGANSSTSLTGSSSTPNATYEWQNPSNVSISTTATATATQTGTYLFIVTNPTNGCKDTVDVIVTADASIPDITASGGIIDCNVSSTIISATSTTSGLDYSWTGPGGYTSAVASNTVSTIGSYNVVITDSSNGCTNSTSVIVADSTTPPSIVTMGNTVGCGSTGVTISANSNTGTSYSWTGPNGYTSTAQNPSDVTDPGDYDVVVTNANGCTNTSTAVVSSNIVLPTVAPSAGMISCDNPNVTVNANSSPTTGVNYAWTGPSGPQTTLSFPTNMGGLYSVTVTNTSNGCTAEGSVNVGTDTVSPILTLTADDNLIDCNNLDVVLTATSNATNYTWSGGITGSSATVTVTQQGLYSVEVEGTNGCVSTQSISIQEDTAQPDVNASDVDITCTNLTPMINATSTVSPATFSWTGPSGFTANTASSTISDAGQYTVIVTNTTNGCTNTTSLMANDLVTTPAITTTNDSLGCGSSATAQLTASSTPGSSYSWTGPGSYTGTGSVVTVPMTGVYTVEVTDASGCTNTETAEVFANTDLPELSTMVGTIDCSQSSTATLSASSTTGGINASDFVWTGPAGTSTGSSVSVSNFDVYTVVVTAPNGCSNSASISASSDTIPPTLTGLSASNDLDCNQTTATLSATSNGISYNWTGPNSFADMATSPTITDGGTYTVVVAGANGCTATDMVTVLQDTISPDVMVDNTTIACGSTGSSLTATSTSTISTYSWSGPNSFTGNTASVIVSDLGNYTVVATAPNGCTNTTTANVGADTNAPNVIAQGGTITCLNTSIDLMGGTDTLGATGVWTITGGGTVSSNFTYSATAPGSYTLTVTGTNGCVNDSTVIVGEDIVLPMVTAISSTPLTCTTTSVTIEGTTDLANPTYSWTGPNGFMSAMQNPNNVVDPGLYTLIIVNPTTGCVDSASVMVDLNATLPDLTASADANVLDCNTTTVNLTSSSTTTGGTYTWVGPGIGGTPTDQNQMITVPGNYEVTVEATNGCTHDTTIVIQIDTISPQGVTAVGGTILCGTSDITLSGSSTTAGVSYSWVGPGNVVYPGQNPTVDEVGTYTLIVESANGCTSTTTANVAEDINAPDADIDLIGVIDCNNSSVQIEGTSTTANVTYTWTTPTNATLAGAGPHTVSDLGSYKLVVEAPNGCSTVRNIATPVDTITPGAISTPITLTCQSPNGSLVGATNSTNNVSYNWTGPNGYVSSAQTAMNVIDGGTYSLTVTDDVNGCTSESTVMVDTDQANPNAFANDAVLDCNTQSLQIDAGSTTAGVTFSWTGPGGFTSSDAMPTVTVGGGYTLTVSDPVTGCSATAMAQINDDTTPPNVAIDAAPLVITCAAPNVTILGSSTTTGASFDWSGPNGFTSTVANPSVTEAGDYVLTVKGPNGCTATENKNVDKDSDFPVLSTEVDGIMTCVVNSVDIHVTETTGQTMTYVWSGPNGFSSTDADTSVPLPGTYTVEGTASNGCQVTSQAIVDINDTKPTAVAGGGFEIDCNILEGTLNADGSATGSNIYYQWSTAQGHIVSDGDSAQPLVDGPGTYELTVTDDTNGCTNTATVEVTADPSIPNDLLLDLRQISCFGENDGAASIQGVIGGAEPFQYSFNGGPFDSKVTYTNLGPGDYPITVIDANGCKLNTGVSVVEPELFTIDLGPDQMVNYGTSVSVNLQVDDTKRVGVIGWNTFLDSTCLLTNPMECYGQQFIAEKTTTFEVAATDTSGCDANDRMIVFVAKPKNVYIPNVFSPNGDNTNDLLLGSTGEGVALIKRFSIFDRWGNLMMEVNDIEPGQNLLLWDGEFKGQAVQPGVFIYRAEVYYLNGDKDSFVGDITLVR